VSTGPPLEPLRVKIITSSFKEFLESLLGRGEESGGATALNEAEEGKQSQFKA
jgi:hypothetical protein